MLTILGILSLLAVTMSLLLRHLSLIVISLVRVSTLPTISLCLLLLRIISLLLLLLLLLLRESLGPKARLLGKPLRCISSRIPLWVVPLLCCILLLLLLLLVGITSLSWVRLVIASLGRVSLVGEA